MKKIKIVSKRAPLGYSWYQLPPFLQGRITVQAYRVWLAHKAHTMHERDVELKRPYALTNLKGVYKQKIHQAVLAGGEFDPYTGEKLNWEGISPKDAVVYGYVSDFLTKYAMLPAVDHISADKFEFEICAWIVNSSKTCMTPDEYVELCGKVTAYRQPAKAKAQAVGRSAKKGRR